MPDSSSNYKHRQVCWRFEKERTPRGSRRVVVVDDARYTVGYCDPGRASDGEFNNCLIDPLMVQLQCYVRDITKNKAYLKRRNGYNSFWICPDYLFDFFIKE